MHDAGFHGKCKYNNIDKCIRVMCSRYVWIWKALRNFSATYTPLLDLNLITSRAENHYEGGIKKPLVIAAHPGGGRSLMESQQARVFIVRACRPVVQNAR